ncbi:glyceraldehyde 3-phosphate dehydrogenase N-terminal domain-containing protein, partial [Flavobacteriaceae bacterium]|nr:glyceraldehyde 3-phosphate dehydrogenase N-terminal domain-containing protein [Flavobacteriaceae bacterium]
MVRVAINGFGRIGRRVFRLLLDHPTIQVVAINDLANAKTLAHLLKYDSIHGRLKRTVSNNDTQLIFDGTAIPLLNKNHPRDVNWIPYNVDIVIEATGKFKTKND